jgi:Putative bacterial sensory transduction regulator
VGQPGVAANDERGERSEPGGKAGGKPEGEPAPRCGNRSNPGNRIREMENIMTGVAKDKAEKAGELNPTIDTVTVEQLGEVFKAAGYRVTPAEQNGIVQLMSASQGVGFAVRFGNPGAQGGTYLDYTLSCALQVQGELPPEIVAGWNRSKRFARLWVQAQFLVLEMDVVVAGGVTERHLRSLIELWDRLIQEFLLHLRNRPAMAAAAGAKLPDTDTDTSQVTMQ